MILVIDTATSLAVVGVGGAEDDSATSVVSRAWPVRHQHGETLLPTLVAFLAERDVSLSDLGGIIVGTGPGAFTGLRVGLATAKGLAHGLGLPIVGVSTAEALIEAAGPSDPGSDVLVLLPAGRTTASPSTPAGLRSSCRAAPSPRRRRAIAWLRWISTGARRRRRSNAARRRFVGWPRPCSGSAWPACAPAGPTISPGSSRST